MKEKIIEKLESHIDKILDKGELKPEDVTLLTILLMSIDNPAINEGDE